MKSCINCKALTKNPKFCCRTCSAQYNNRCFPKRKLLRTCTRCAQIVKSYRHILCEVHHQEYLHSRTVFTQNLTLEAYWKKKSLEGLHKSSKNAHVRILCRNTHKDLLTQPCRKCGYSKHVELCHLQPISSFPPTATIAEVNALSNIVQLCRNCHWELDHGLFDVCTIQGSNL